MSANRIPQAVNAFRLPVGTDLDTGEEVLLDFDANPHLLTAGWTGGGITTLLRHVVASAVGSGAVVTVIDPKRAGFADLAGVPGVTIARTAAEMAEEIKAFHAEVMHRYTSGQQGPEGPRKVLVVDELTQLLAWIKSGGNADLDAAAQLLRPIVLLGRYVGCHLAVDVTHETLTWFGLDKSALRNVATIAMGRPSRAVLSRLGIEPALAGGQRGTGVLRLPGDKGRRLAVTYLADTELRALALGVIHS